MKIKINNKEITLNPKDVKAAKKIITKLIWNVRERTWEAGHPTFYFTFLIVMHLVSQEAIDHMDPAMLQRIMNAFNGD